MGNIEFRTECNFLELSKLLYNTSIGEYSVWISEAIGDRIIEPHATVCALGSQCRFLKRLQSYIERWRYIYIYNIYYTYTIIHYIYIQRGDGYQRVAGTHMACLWDTVGHMARLWDNMEHCGTLWDTVGHYGTIWDTVGH